MNTFSIKRLGLLLRQELKIQGWEMLIGLATAIIVVVFLTLISDGGYEAGEYDVRVYSRVLTFYMPAMVLGFSFAFFMRVHNMLHAKNTLPYVSIPASTIEKYIEIILLGLIYYVMACVAIQITYWVELWQYPDLKGINIGDGTWHESILIGETSLFNPLAIFKNGFSLSTLYTGGILLLITTLISKKKYAIPLYFIIPVAIVAVSIYILTEFYETTSINLASDEEWNGAEIIEASVLGGLGTLCLIGSYFALRTKQVKS